MSGDLGGLLSARQEARNERAWQAWLRQRAEEGQQGASGQSGPSPLGRTAQTTLESAGQAVNSIVTGLSRLLSVSPTTPGASFGQGMVEAYKDKMDAARQVVVEGLMGLPFALPTGISAGIGEWLGQSHPDVANAMLSDGFAAAGMRGLLQGRSFKEMTPDERAHAVTPLTVREVVETVGPLALMAALPGAVQVGKKAGKAVGSALEQPAIRGALAGERGSIGSEAIRTIGPRTERHDRGRTIYQIIEMSEAYLPKSGEDLTSRFTVIGRGESLTGKAPKAGDAAWVIYEHTPGGVETRVATGLTKAEAITQAKGLLGEQIRQVRQESAPTVGDVLKAERGSLMLGEGGGEPPAKPPTPTAGAGGEARPGPEGAPYVGEARINVERLAGTEDVKHVAATVNALASERLSESRRVRTHGEQIGEAKRVTVEQALEMDPFSVPLGEARAWKLGFRDLNLAVDEHIATLMKEVQDGNLGRMGELEQTTSLGILLSAKQEMFSTEYGRGLEAQKILAEGPRARYTPEDVNRIRQTIRQEGVDGVTLSNQLALIGTGPTRIRQFIEDAARWITVGRDALHWAWINNLLSGPQTHAANVLGTGGVVSWHMPERYLGEWVNRLFRHDPEGVQRRETLAFARGLVTAQMDALRAFGKTLKTGDDPIVGQMPKSEARFDFNAQALGLDPESPVGKMVDIAAMAVPTRVLRAEDAYAKTLVRRGELEALAIRQASRDGFGPGHRTFNETVDHYKRNPTEQMIAEANDMAGVLTLNREFGAVGHEISRSVNKLPFVRWIVPFQRVSVNIGKWVWQRAPLTAELSAQNWQDVLAGGAKRDMAIARVTLGHAAAAGIVALVLEGKLTGSGPTDPNIKRDMRADGWQPYSVRVGDDFYSINRLDPVGMYLGAVADAVEIYSQIPDPKGEHWLEMATVLGLVAGHNALNKTWMTGLNNVVEAIKQPDRNAKKLAAGFARSVVPSFVRQVTRSGVPGLIAPRPEIRELRTLMDSIRAGVPWLADEVPIRIHPITGDPITYPPGWGPDLVSPIYVTRRAHDLVLDEIVRNQISLPMPSRWLAGRRPPELEMQEPRPGEGVMLTTGEYERLLILMSREPDGTGRTMYETMRDEIQSPGWDLRSNGPGGGKDEVLGNIYRAYMRMARGKLLEEEPMLRGLVETSAIQRGEAKADIDIPRTVAPVQRRAGTPVFLRSLTR